MRVHKTPIRMDPAGPELRCRHCDEFWPITLEHWHVQRDGHLRADRCRLCNNESARLYQALRRLDPTFQTHERLRHRNYYRNWYRPAIKKHHPDLLDAYDRDKRERERNEARERRASPEAIGWALRDELELNAVNAA
jgi:hypothetical protein